MLNLTVNDLATILQLDEAIKDNLQKNYQNYPDEKKYDVLSILWDGVHELKKKLADLKYQQFMTEVDSGKREMTNDMYEQAVKAVWQDFKDILVGKNKDVEEIEKIRSQLRMKVNDYLIQEKQNNPKLIISDKPIQ